VSVGRGHPLQNRVLPDGEIVAIPDRGLFMGNRGGRIHDPATRTLLRRRYTSRAWICCLLAFRDRHEVVMGPGYTQLFFTDEPTALAAGHRPCWFCRRQDALAYAAAVGEGLGLAERPTAPELDRLLHAERLDGRRKRLHRLPLASLPDGAMLVRDGAFLAARGKQLLRYSPAGYTAAERRPRRADVDVLTPPTSLAALRAGFAPRWHPTAGTAR
jgi:hypothetical protein